MKRIFSEIIGRIQNFLRATSHRMSCSKYSKTVLFCRELTQQAMKLYPRTRTISGAVLDPCGPSIGHPQSRGAEQVNLIRILKTTHVVGRARGIPRPYGCRDPQHGAQSNISAGKCLTAASEYPLESSHNNAAQVGVEG